MRSSTTIVLVLAAIAVLNTVVSADAYKEPAPVCKPAGVRCKGAPGKPAVPWGVGCCKGLSCDEPDTRKGGYGYLCVKPKAPKCYGPGMRCIGAPGKPGVPYLGCCSGECSVMKKGEWGLFCPMEAPKCYAPGQRCIGAPGKPGVPYLGCCKGTCSMTKKGDWGIFCTTGGHPAPRSIPVKPKPAPKKCYDEGERCIGAPGKPGVPYLGCCSGSCSVTKYGDWGVFCSSYHAPPPMKKPPMKKPPMKKPPTRSYPKKISPPACIKKGNSCASGSCCSGLICTKSYGGYGRYGSSGTTYTCMDDPSGPPQPGSSPAA